MYNLAVGAQLKNEADSIVEWIEHYILHGVEHFYLIDDNSTDNSVELLQPYIKKNLVTIFQAKWDNYLGRQHHMYNHYIMPRLKAKEMKWLAIVDLDEYLWSPRNTDMREVLNECEHLGQMQICHTIYGSNGYVIQPESMVKYFTKRSSQNPTKEPGNFKYIVNSSFEFTSINVHYAKFLHEEDEKKRFIIVGPDYFILNHYCCQSRDYWNKIKCTRGDSDAYRIRQESEFNAVDINEEEDFGLFNQNKC
jgi:hypothetical protein